MSDFTLRYAGYHKPIEDLAVGECTVRPCAEPNGTTSYLLWFYVLDDEGVALETLEVPIIPNGLFTPAGPGGRSWGFTRAGAGVWQVSPSINVLPHPVTPGAKFIHPGNHPTITTSHWHHTPEVLGVPEGEPWQ
jgi:hypothetical protein